MIVLDGVCYRATENGAVEVAKPDKGVPFSAVCKMSDNRAIELGQFDDIDSLKSALNNLIEEHFGLNSMHMVRIDGEFGLVDARSESSYKSIHVSLKDILGKTQKAFQFKNIKGTLVCVYFPDIIR